MRNEEEIKGQLKEIRRLMERPGEYPNGYAHAIRLIRHGYEEALRWVVEGETKFPRDIFQVIHNITGVELRNKKTKNGKK